MQFFFLDPQWRPYGKMNGVIRLEPLAGQRDLGLRAGTLRVGGGKGKPSPEMLLVEIEPSTFRLKGYFLTTRLSLVWCCVLQLYETIHGSITRCKPVLSRLLEKRWR